MTREREIELALKRQRLQWQSEACRQELSQAAQGFKPWLHAVDRVRGGVRYAKAHPEFLAVAAVLMALFRPRRSFSWARRGLSLWRVWGRIKSQWLGL